LGILANNAGFLIDQSEAPNFSKNHRLSRRIFELNIPNEIRFAHFGDNPTLPESGLGKQTLPSLRSGSGTHPSLRYGSSTAFRFGHNPSFDCVQGSGTGLGTSLRFGHKPFHRFAQVRAPLNLGLRQPPSLNRPPRSRLSVTLDYVSLETIFQKGKL
jgi:hypothetical protein